MDDKIEIRFSSVGIFVTLNNQELFKALSVYKLKEFIGTLFNLLEIKNQAPLTALARFRSNSNTDTDSVEE
jgi:hypothetical protein